MGPLQGEFEEERERQRQEHVAAMRAAREEEREAADTHKEKALDDLAETLIPKIEQQLSQAHRDEIRKYHKKCEDLKKKVDEMERLEQVCAQRAEDAEGHAAAAAEQVEELRRQIKAKDEEIALLAARSRAADVKLDQVVSVWVRVYVCVCVSVCM